MKKTVLIDTSFLITPSDANRANHNSAKAFYKHFLDNEISMYISTIVISEFCIKQPISDLPLYNFLILPFNLPNAVMSAKLDFTLYKNSGVKRECMKDDFKIIAQAITQKCDYFITDDSKLVDKVLIPNQSQLKYSFIPIKIEEGTTRYFGGRQLSIDD